MDYKRIYDQIISRAQKELEQRKKKREEGVYFEGHHIIPKSKGGKGKSKDWDHPNIVPLTAREHLLCHWLLSREYGGSYDKAFFAMCYLKNDSTEKGRRTPSLRVLAEAREAAARHSSNFHTGKVVSEETKAKISRALKGVPKSEQAKQAMRHPNSVPSPLKGVKHSKKRVEKNRNGQPNRREVNQYDLDGNLIRKWDSISLAVKQYGIGVSHCLMGRQKQTKGFIWKYTTNKPPMKRIGGKKAKN